MNKPIIIILAALMSVSLISCNTTQDTNVYDTNETIDATKVSIVNEETVTKSEFRNNKVETDGVSFVYDEAIAANEIRIEKLDEKTEKKSSIEIPDSTDKNGVPNWFYEIPSSQESFYTTGFSVASSTKVGIKKAEMDAKNHIAQWVKTSVKEVIIDYVIDSGEGTDRQNLDLYNSISLQVVDESLKGIKREKLQIADDNSVYVLMSIPFENVQNAFAQATNRL